MTVLTWTLIIMGWIMSAIQLGIMTHSLVNYIKDKIWAKTVQKEMLKKYKKI